MSVLIYKPSMFFFCVAITPLLHSLNRQLTGFTRMTIFLKGPLEELVSSPIQVSDTFKLLSYVDNLNLTIRTLDEINL